MPTTIGLTPAGNPRARGLVLRRLKPSVRRLTSALTGTWGGKMRINQAQRMAIAGGGVPLTRIVVNTEAGLVIWEPSGEVRTLRCRLIERQAEERKAS